MDPSFAALATNGESRGPFIHGVQWSLQVLSAVFLGLRLYCKFWRQRRLWWDDHFLIFSWVGRRPGTTTARRAAPPV